MPDSTTPTNNGMAIVDVNSSAYAGWLFSPKVVSGATTGPEMLTASSGLVTTLYYNGITYSNLTSNGVNYLFAAGSSSGAAPYIAAFGVDTDIDIELQAKGAGVLQLQYASIALGGGAAATLGSIGGSGPGAAAQAAWGKIKWGTTPYFVALWST